MSKNTTSAFDLFGKSYDVVMRNFKTFAILLFLPFLSSLSSTVRGPDKAATEDTWFNLNFVNGTMPAYSIVGIVGLGIFLFVAIAVVALFIQAMLTGLQLESAQGKTPSLAHLWQLGKKYWLRLFGLILIVGLYIIAMCIPGLLVLVILRNGLGLVLGSALLIAAVLFVLLHYFLSPFAMLDKDLSPLSALEHSAKISKGHVRAILSVIGVMVLLSATTILPVLGPLISFALGAFYSVAPALLYLEIKQLH